jgi:hypothetical protein
MNTTIILVWRSGGKFTFKDVELITYHLHKWNEGIKIICVTNKVEIEFDLEKIKMIPMEIKLEGWWSKLNLFSPQLEKYRPFLYLDLDTAVVGALDNIIPSSDILKNSFITLEDFYQKNKLASGVMWIPKDSEKVRQIWEVSLNKKQINKNKRLDYFLREITTSLFFQDYTNKIRSFKPTQKNYLTELPENISVVCFHGSPDIFEVKDVDWVFKYIQETEI